MSRRRRLVLPSVIALALLLVVLVVASRAGFVGEVAARFREAGPRGKLIELGSVEQLQSSFNAASGSPRLVLLLSPT